MSIELYKQIDEVLKHVPENRHSYFQLKYFVIGKEPTTQAKLWQCLRELQSRKETIDDILLNIDEAKDEIELLDIKQVKEAMASREMEPLAEKEWIINNRQIARRRTKLLKTVEQLELQATFATQEARFFLQAFEGLNQIEKVKDYDDFDAQKEYWNERIAQQINLKILLQQPVDTELAQTALALHDDAPIKNQMVGLLGRIEDKANRDN